VIAETGMVVRPGAPRKAGPAPGTTVNYRVSQPIMDLARQAESLGWPVLGVVGNTDHLRGNGDHTPWSAGKQPGVIYAIDVHPPDGFEAWLVAACRSDYDTDWIDFFNIDGRQYSSAGQLLASSGDQHLHISVARGHERDRVTLFTDYATGGDGMPTAKEVAEAVWAEGVSSPTLDKGAAHGAHEGVINAIVSARALKELLDTVDGLVMAVGQLKAARVDPAVLAETVAAKVAAKLAAPK
jgi:hypothetical protein